MADRCKQRDQLPQLYFIEMAELLPMDLVNPVLYLVEQLQSASRDPRHHVPSVLAAPLPDDQLRVFEAIEQACDVRNLPDQSLRNLVSTETLRLRPTQNPQNVVLGGRYAMRFQRGLEGVLKQRRRPLNAQVSFLFQTLEGPHLFQFCLQLRRHPTILRVITHIVKVSRIAPSACAIAQPICPNSNTNGFRVLRCKSAGHVPGAIGGCPTPEHTSRTLS